MRKSRGSGNRQVPWEGITTKGAVDCPQRGTEYRGGRVTKTGTGERIEVESWLSPNATEILGGGVENV